MLVSKNPMRIYELLFEYVQANQCAVAVVDNKNYFTLSPQEQEEMKSFYSEFMDEDIFREIFENDYTFFPTKTIGAAIDICSENFPRKDQLDNDKFWIHVYALDTNGTIPYENGYLITQENVEPDFSQTGA